VNHHRQNTKKIPRRKLRCWLAAVGEPCDFEEKLEQFLAKPANR